MQSIGGGGSGPRAPPPKGQESRPPPDVPRLGKPSKSYCQAVQDNAVFRASAKARHQKTPMTQVKLAPRPSRRSASPTSARRDSSTAGSPGSARARRGSDVAFWGEQHSSSPKAQDTTQPPPTAPTYGSSSGRSAPTSPNQAKSVPPLSPSRSASVYSNNEALAATAAGAPDESTEAPVYRADTIAPAPNGKRTQRNQRNHTDPDDDSEKLNGTLHSDVQLSPLTTASPSPAITPRKRDEEKPMNSRHQGKGARRTVLDGSPVVAEREARLRRMQHGARSTDKHLETQAFRTAVLCTAAVARNPQMAAEFLSDDTHLGNLDLARSSSPTATATATVPPASRSGSIFQRILTDDPPPVVQPAADRSGSPNSTVQQPRSIRRASIASGGQQHGGVSATNTGTLGLGTRTRKTTLKDEVDMIPLAEVPATKLISVMLDQASTKAARSRNQINGSPSSRCGSPRGASSPPSSPQTGAVSATHPPASPPQHRPRAGSSRRSASPAHALRVSYAGRSSSAGAGSYAGSPRSGSAAGGSGGVIAGMPPLNLPHAAVGSALLDSATQEEVFDALRSASPRSRCPTDDPLPGMFAAHPATSTVYPEPRKPGLHAQPKYEWSAAEVHETLFDPTELREALLTPRTTVANTSMAGPHGTPSTHALDTHAATYHPSHGGGVDSRSTSPTKGTPSKAQHHQD